MKVKIAVFGRGKLIERINEYTRDRDDIEIVPFIYTNAVEVLDLIEKAFMCDVYLFGGSLPYLYAKEKIERKRLPATQVVFDDYMILTSFYRLKDSNQELNRISVDVLDEQFVDEVVAELTLEDRDIYTHSYGEDPVPDIGKISHFHKALYEAGKVDYALTSIEEVEQRLAMEGIPTSSMKIPKLNVERAIERAKSIATLNKSKSAQVVAGFVQIKELDNLVAKKGESFVRKSLAKLHHILLEFGQRTSASIIANRDNEFTIIGTKGVLDHITNHYRDLPLLQEIARTLGVPVDIGFGLGLTAKQAEDNAKLALENCSTTEESSSYIVNERREIIGPLGITKHVDTSQLYHALIHRARLNNELSYNFIDFINLRNNEPFSANDISNYYQVTKRSAERTIHKLLDGYVIRASGEEKPYLKGRPRKLFKLTL